MIQRRDRVGDRDPARPVEHHQRALVDHIGGQPGARGDPQPGAVLKTDKIVLEEIRPVGPAGAGRQNIGRALGRRGGLGGDLPAFNRGACDRVEPAERFVYGDVFLGLGRHQPGQAEAGR
jgi:hypothetical protein